ncbi:MAG: iron-containing alcohol dehydrogenase [Oscillospiraceae bacterium]|nr:iron-containing alcohol dehydrogenase [Oscillospiraceae bacterium]
MSFFYTLYCRAFQSALYLAAFLLPWREPVKLEGEGALSRLPALIKELGLSRVLLVCGRHTSALGLTAPLLKGLEAEGVACLVYDGSVPNPTDTCVEEAYKIYREGACEGIIAFGGGSPMDLAKAAAARAARPSKTLLQMAGTLKIMKKLPPLFAIPTTAGSGSETTLAAVITEEATHHKFTMQDPALIPGWAVLDPSLTLKLPPGVTAATGMDALCHAVEAYIGRANTAATRKHALEAVRLVSENLYEAFENGENIAARANMQRASYLAGLAFTRAYVGYVHALSHALSGLYGLGHGLANAVLLPYVLRAYGESVRRPLSELAARVGLKKDGEKLVCSKSVLNALVPPPSVGEPERKSPLNGVLGESSPAESFILWIEEMNAKMGIPSKLEEIKEEDLPLLVSRALKEANPLYPVPKIMGAEELVAIYREAGGLS